MSSQANTASRTALRQDMIHPDLLSDIEGGALDPHGRRLTHAEAASRSMRSKVREPQPRGARIHGSRPVDQSEAAARFIGATEHEKMHDERLWDLRRKRDRVMHTSKSGRNYVSSHRKSNSTRLPISTDILRNSKLRRPPME